MLKYIFVSLGLMCLTLGVMGLAIPGLPTTPFILLAAYLFSKSSPKLHEKLLDNKYIGRYIKRLENGISVKGLIISLSIMWIMIMFSIFVAFNKNENMQLVMLLLGIVGSISQIIVYYRKKNKKHKAQATEVIETIENY